MIDALLRFDFLQNAFFSGLIIGVIAPLLGVFIVVRKMSLIADALSHVTLAGIASSFYLSTLFPNILFNTIYFGMGSSVLGALLIERLRTLYKHYEELAIPIIMSAGIGLSAIFISLSKGINVDLTSFLFGSVSAVSRQDLWIVVGIAIIIIVFLILFFKELFLLSFDEEYAKATGIPFKVLHFLFIIIVALMIAACMRIVGILLVSSLITLPVATAMRIGKGFKQTILYSILFGESAVIIGLVSAFYLDLAPGGTIVVTSIILLLITIVAKKILVNARAKKGRVV